MTFVIDFCLHYSSPGSQGTIYSSREDDGHPLHSPHRGQAREYQYTADTRDEVRSSVSMASTQVRTPPPRTATLLQDKKMRKEQKKSSRNKKLSRLFASDCEEELQSVVSDNPHLYNRSSSMVRGWIYILLTV